MNKPQQVFRVGAIEAACFLNEFETDNGMQHAYSVNIHRHFYDKKEKVWKKNSAFRLADLPQLQLVTQLATDYVAQREAQQIEGGVTS